MYFAEDHVKQITIVTLAFTMDTGNKIMLYIKDFVVFVPGVCRCLQYIQWLHIEYMYIEKVNLGMKGIKL